MTPQKTEILINKGMGDSSPSKYDNYDKSSNFSKTQTDGDTGEKDGVKTELIRTPPESTTTPNHYLCPNAVG